MQEDIDREREERRRRKQYQLELAIVEKGVNQLISTLEGRAFLWWMLTETNLFTQTQALDPIQTAFNNGVRDAGLRLLTLIDSINPAIFPQLQLERISNVNRRTADTGTRDLFDTDDTD